MNFKTYVLSDSLNPTAPIYNRVNKHQRVRINKLPTWQPYLQITFIDKDGKNRTHRYKSTTDEIDQAKQIKDQNIPANDRYTTAERNDLIFRNGVLTTAKPTAQKYLENYPGCEGFEGMCDAPGVTAGQFRLLEKSKEIKISNIDIRRRAQAALKITDFDLKQSQEMLIQINGGFFKPSEDVEENIQLLINWLDVAEDDGVDMILSGEINIDDQVELLVGRLLNADVLKISETDGIVSKKRGKDWVTVRKFSDNHPMEEKKRLFIEFLNSPEGADLKSDLEKELVKVDAKYQGVGMPREEQVPELVEAGGNDLTEDVQETAKRGRKPNK